MDDLKTALATLSEADGKAFAQFIRRQKATKSRKDLALFRLLQHRPVLSSPEIIARLYPAGGNSVAYYALRKRLTRHFTDFLLLKQTEEDNTAASSLMGTISLVRYLFAAQADRIAWSTLRKAEKLAAETEQYGLLNTIYHLQIEHADRAHADPLEGMLEKQAQNKQLADEAERANVARSLIKHRLAEVRRQGRVEGLDFEQITREVLGAYALSDVVSRRPALLYQLVYIARSAVLVKKDFYTFETYIRGQYHRLEAEGGFKPAHQYYQQQFLYMIAQTLYRTRKFAESVAYLDQLRRDFDTGQKSYGQDMYPRYVLLLAANNVFLRNPGHSIALLEDLLGDPTIRLGHSDRLNALLNLGFYYFQQKAYAKANQTLRKIHHSEAWCTEKMGREWTLKKSLSELILQYELGHVDLALNQMRSIERNFSELLRQPPYQNVRGYLGLVKRMLGQPHDVHRPDFLRHVERTLTFAPAEREDMQAINFYAWLKSKMVQRDYYEVLLELIGGR